MWFVYYMHVNHLYSVYSNLAVYTGKKRTSLVVNRFNVGLHVSHVRPADVSRLLDDWNNEYVAFPNNLERLDWDGSYIPNNRKY